jgi:hypothetical protein
MQGKVIGIIGVFLMCSQAAVAGDLPNCRTIRDSGKKFRCLEDSIAILQNQRAENTVQTGTINFGENQKNSPDWSLQELPGAEPMSWTSPPISFPRSFSTKPSVFVSITGIESGANLDTGRFGFSVEATDINETSFKIAVRASQGLLYGVSVSWLASGTEKPRLRSAQ